MPPRQMSWKFSPRPIFADARAAAFSRRPPATPRRPPSRTPPAYQTAAAAAFFFFFFFFFFCPERDARYTPLPHAAHHIDGDAEEQQDMLGSARGPLLMHFFFFLPVQPRHMLFAVIFA